MNIEIRTPGMGYGSTVVIEGQQLRGVKRVELIIGAHELTTLVIERYVHSDDGTVQVVRPEGGAITVVTEHGTLELANPDEPGIVSLIETYNVSGSITLEGTLRAQEARVM